MNTFATFLIPERALQIMFLTGLHRYCGGREVQV